jgi:hypothetical protein
MFLGFRLVTAQLVVVLFFAEIIWVNSVDLGQSFTYRP